MADIFPINNGPSWDAVVLQEARPKDGVQSFEGGIVVRGYEWPEYDEYDEEEMMCVDFYGQNDSFNIPKEQIETSLKFGGVKLYLIEYVPIDGIPVIRYADYPITQERNHLIYSLLGYYTTNAGYSNGRSPLEYIMVTPMYCDDEPFKIEITEAETKIMETIKCIKNKMQTRPSYIY